MNYSQIVEFHGHACPGLAIGYRMANAAMDELRSMRSADEEVVAVVEDDACGVDALQCVTGCTFGKGIPDNLRDDRAALADRILKAPAGSILSVSRVHVPEPKPAKIGKSVPCAFCGELVMESRLREVDGNPLASRVQRNSRFWNNRNILLTEGAMS